MPSSQPIKTSIILCDDKAYFSVGCLFLRWTHGQECFNWAQVITSGAMRIFSLLVFISPVLSFQTNYCVCYPVLPVSDRFLHHTVLPEVGVMLVKTVPWPSRLVLSWVIPESDNSKNLHTLSILWVCLSIPPLTLPMIPKHESVPLRHRSLPGARGVLEHYLQALAW